MLSSTSFSRSRFGLAIDYAQGISALRPGDDGGDSVDSARSSWASRTYCTYVDGKMASIQYATLVNARLVGAYDGPAVLLPEQCQPASQPHHMLLRLEGARQLSVEPQHEMR